MDGTKGCHLPQRVCHPPYYLGHLGQLFRSSGWYQLMFVILNAFAPGLPNDALTLMTKFDTRQERYPQDIPKVHAFGTYIHQSIDFCSPVSACMPA